MKLLTIQALKTCLFYLMETNGELHLYLNNYIAQNPLTDDVDEWLVELAAAPLTKVESKMNARVPTIESLQLKFREVSPRDVVERVLSFQAELAKEFCKSLEKLGVENAKILRKALERTLSLGDLE